MLYIIPKIKGDSYKIQALERLRNSFKSKFKEAQQYTFKC